jgi:hypothetical protein
MSILIGVSIGSVDGNLTRIYDHRKALKALIDIIENLRESNWNSHNSFELDLKSCLIIELSRSISSSS